MEEDVKELEPFTWGVQYNMLSLQKFVEQHKREYDTNAPTLDYLYGVLMNTRNIREQIDPNNTVHVFFGLRSKQDVLNIDKNSRMNNQTAETRTALLFYLLKINVIT